MKTIKWILILFLLQACTKGGGNIYVEGRVYNPLTGEGISNVELRLYRPKTGGTIGNSSGNKTVETVYTDAEGHYEISHLGGAYTYRLLISDNPDEFHLLGTAPNNYDVPEGNKAFIVEKGTNMEVNFEVVPLGRLKFHIKNQNCFDGSDNIKLYYEGAEIEDEPSRVGDILTELEGCVDVLSDIDHIHPEGYRYYRWVSTKNGITQNHSDSVYIESGQTKILEVYY